MNISEIINNVIGNIFLIFASFVLAILVTKEKVKVFSSKFIISSILVLILSTYGTYYLDSVIKSVVSFISILVFLKINFHLNWLKTIFLTFIYLIILMLADTLFILILIQIFKLSSTEIEKYFAETILGNVCISMITILVSILIRKTVKYILNIKVTSNKMIVIFSLLTSICVFIVFYYGFANLKLDINMYISVAVMIIFLVILFTLIREKIKKDRIENQYDSLMEFLVEYEDEVEKQRIIHHENKNQLISIKSKLTDQDTNENIIQYIDSLLKDEIVFEKSKYAKFKLLPLNGIKGLFYYKVSFAEKKKIKVSVEINSNINNSIIHHLDTEEYKQFNRIVGVYFDNAIEASAESQERLLGIEINLLDNKDICINISNSYADTINISKIDHPGYSTKGTKRGYGLSLVKKILKDNDRFAEEKEITDTIYTQKLYIKANKNCSN